MSSLRKGLQMSDQPYRYDSDYWRYDTTLYDTRITKFIEALAKHAKIRFSERVFVIQHIHLTPVRAEIVLREVNE